jgi:hypothetical protein
VDESAPDSLENEYATLQAQLETQRQNHLDMKLSFTKQTEGALIAPPPEPML